MSGSPIFVRAIRGPVILITVGVLFAIDHAGGLPFERTWPAIIIIIGLLKLMERVVTPQHYDPAYPSGPAWTPGATPVNPTWAPGATAVNSPHPADPGHAWTRQYPGGYRPAPSSTEPPAGTTPADPNEGGPRP